MAKFSLVDKESCIACGACGGTAPDLFDFDGEGLAHFVIDDNNGIIEIPEILEEDLDNAVAGCPSEAIKVQNSPFK